MKRFKPLAVACATAIIALVATAVLPAVAQADSAKLIEEITIVGTQTNEKQVSGAAQYLGAAQLEQQTYSDIQRVLRQVPGVSLQIEDGYGLRPNISIRGVATERSGRITLLEDNILISPAPYSAPSAYYFPTAGRMHAVEILKGPSAIKQGPYTIGGAMNMISTPIPRSASGKFMAEAAGDNTWRMHASYGNTLDNGFSYLIETHHWQSDGYQNIDSSNNKTGLDVEDYTAKLAYSRGSHSVELKLQYAEQLSEQSYLGLTDADFSADAFRRYGLSALDNIDTKHIQQILRYRFDISDSASLTTSAYNNEHERDWFKTEGIDFDGSTSAETFSRTSWSNLINAINAGNDLAGLSAHQMQGILDGSADTLPGSIQLRSNAREYFSRGIQFELDWQLQTREASHEIEIGLRLHKDEEDRLQRNSNYHQENGQLVLDDIGLLGNAGNRLQEASARAFFIQDRIEVGRWVLTPGIRLEDIDQKRTRWEIRNGRTSDPASRSDANYRDSRENETRVWLPGIGVLYTLTDQATLVAGIHKGFTAPSNSPNVDEEEAINYELGLRFENAALSLESILFLSDYDNLLGECTASSGSDCTIGDAFNGDAATVQGLELMLSSSYLGGRLPVSLNYTYIHSEFNSDIKDTDFFGSVSKGDPIPYIPEHQLNLSVGYEMNNWRSYINVSYVDEVCVRATCSNLERTDSSLVMDLSSHYDFSENVSFYGKLENITGEEDIMGRQPYGARPNKDRTATLGVRINF